MSTLKLEYDPVRGGFCIHFGEFDRELSTELFDGMAKAYRSEFGRITAVESFLEHGGLKLRGMSEYRGVPQDGWHCARPGPSAQVGPVMLRQTPDWFELWFGGPALRDENGTFDARTGIWIWFEGQIPELPTPSFARHIKKFLSWVARIRISFAESVASYPIETMSVRAEDFKG